jgi:hypothetical protein
MVRAVEELGAGRRSADPEAAGGCAGDVGEPAEVERMAE